MGEVTDRQTDRQTETEREREREREWQLQRAKENRVRLENSRVEGRQMCAHTNLTVSSVWTMQRITFENTAKILLAAWKRYKKKKKKTVIGYSNPRTVLNPRCRKSCTTPGLHTEFLSFFAQLEVSRLLSIVRRKKENRYRSIIVCTETMRSKAFAVYWCWHNH